MKGYTLIWGDIESALQKEKSHMAVENETFSDFIQDIVSFTDITSDKSFNCMEIIASITMFKVLLESIQTGYISP